MKLPLLPLGLLGLLCACLPSAHATSPASPACDGCKAEPRPLAAGHDTAAPRKHPLRCIAIDFLADQSSLLVKHEDIYGLMPSMTMMFKADAATLQAVRKGQTITGFLVQRNGDF